MIYSSFFFPNVSESKYGISKKALSKAKSFIYLLIPVVINFITVMILIRFYCCLLIVLFAFILSELAQLCSTGINEGTVGKDKSVPTSGKFCRAKALAMLWSSVQLMASAMASTPRQFAAVNCFSGVDKRRSREMWRGIERQTGEDGETKTRRKQRHRQID